MTLEEWVRRIFEESNQRMAKIMEGEYDPREIRSAQREADRQIKEMRKLIRAKLSKRT